MAKKKWIPLERQQKLKGKQRMSKDLTARRYDELKKSGMTQKQATLMIGKLVLSFYGIDYVRR